MMIPPSLPPHVAKLPPASSSLAHPVKQMGQPSDSYLPTLGQAPPHCPWSELSQGPSNRSWLDGQLQQGFDLDSVRQAKSICVQLQGARAEDSLLTLGAALALGKPTVLLAQERQQLPWFLRQAEESYPGLVQVLEGEATSARVQEALEGLQTGPLPPDRLLQEPVDSFIGCLMSGLTEAQYQEGKGHLGAISLSLQDHLGFKAPYCEGIRVQSTASFDQPRDSLVIDLEALRRAQHCIFYVYEGTPRPSGMWVEMGAALAWDKPSVLLTPGEAPLPPALRGQAQGVKKLHYRDHAQLLEQLRQPESAGSILSP